MFFFKRLDSRFRGNDRLVGNDRQGGNDRLVGNDRQGGNDRRVREGLLKQG